MSDILPGSDWSAGSDLTASLIESTKPVQVIGGHQCTWVPLTTGYCDHLEETVPPPSMLSSSYVSTAPLSQLGGKSRRVRIMAIEDGTGLTFNPTQAGPATLDAGQFFETSSSVDHFQIVGTRPLMVVEFMTGGGGPPNVGDPAMAILEGVDRFRTSHTFVAPTNYTQNYVNIVAPAGATVSLDGTELPSADFTAIGTSGYSVARKLLSNSGSGQHTIEASAPVGMTVYGYGDQTSYWY